MIQLKEVTLFFIIYTSTLFLASTYAATVEKVGKEVDDTVIVTKIKVLYAKDKELNPFKIEVSSHNGSVMLKGTVDTDHQYENAVMIADSVHGVKAVDAESLTVKESKHPIKDTYITAKIKGKLIKNKILDLKNIKYWTVKVETKNGVVHLSGTVDSQQQKNNIINIARSVKDVKSVQSSGLTVK